VVSKKENEMKKALVMFFVIGSMFVGTPQVTAHCEIPCGIYTDDMRIHMIEEDITTIEKSMKKIIELSKDANKNSNQLVRWVMNKEEHANKIQKIVTQYFMTQRIKPVEDKFSGEYKKYVKELSLLHEMLITAMKTKQSTELKYVTRLRELTAEFEKSYLKKK
jgi:nickel superoxide dismutase